MKISKVWDGTRPGATPGKTFTADISPEQLVLNGKRLDYFMLALKGAISTAAVAIEDFSVFLSEFVVKVGGEERIANLTGQDLAALSAAWFKTIPVIGENTDNTGNDFLSNIKVPIFASIDLAKPITVGASYTAVTNVGTNTIGLTAHCDKSAIAQKAIHAVGIGHTTAGSAGYETLGFRMPPVGVMKKLILRNLPASDFTDANIDVSVQRINILVDGKVEHELNVLTDAEGLAMIDFVTPLPIADLLRPYKVFDFGDEGIDCKGKEVVVQLDVEDVSDAIKLIPVMEMA
ncbi:MAG: hypothetical protein WCV87_03760 [Candidatus Paceibacterota bacterium]|jgi:hypothetical protein